MPLLLNQDDAGFDAAFRAFLYSRTQEPVDVRETVSAIIADVCTRGDTALVDYTQRFDRFDLTADTLTITNPEREAARSRCSPDVVAALELAAQRIRTYHEKQLPSDYRYTDDTGTTLGWRWTSVDAAGLYVPGGRASYPSSVLHNAIPARVAGVKTLSMVVPTPDGDINPAILVAANIAGVDHIYRVGGAQAIAALAYGTATITAVDIIVGPGNAYVAEAKRQVFGRVGIDMIAGPSEILVVADEHNNADWIAADLLSQAEHDPMARAVLITDDAGFAKAVQHAVDRTLDSLARKEIAAAAWRDHGAIILVRSLEDAVPLINAIAAEHLELAVEKPDALLPAIRHAGAIFLGRYSPEAIGDYVAGPSHVLPTSSTARFSSGLSVYDFLKKSSIIHCTDKSFQSIGKQAEDLASSEGLGAHALSVKLRRNN